MVHRWIREPMKSLLWLVLFVGAVFAVAYVVGSESRRSGAARSTLDERIRAANAKLPREWLRMRTTRPVPVPPLRDEDWEW